MTIPDVEERPTQKPQADVVDALGSPSSGHSRSSQPGPSTASRQEDDDVLEQTAGASTSPGVHSDQNEESDRPSSSPQTKSKANLPLPSSSPGPVTPSNTESEEDTSEAEEQFHYEMRSKVPRGSLDYFYSIIPPLRYGLDVEKISESLIESGDLVKHEDTYMWRELQQEPEKKTRPVVDDDDFYTYSREDENIRVYNEPLRNIFDAIIRAAQQTTDVTPTLNMVCNDDHRPWSTERGPARPDACLVPQVSEESMDDKLLWYNIAVPFKLKTAPGPEYVFKSVQRIVINMQQLMRVDPTRRHVYGFNIEYNRLRMWIGTRAMLVASKSFDMRTEYKVLIRLFLSLAFASKEELGWDTTIKAKLEGGDRLYDIEIDGEHYYTSDSAAISAGKVDYLVGSGTRIWRARRGSREDGEIVVIKDFWQNERRRPEDQVHGMILDSISDPEKKEFFRKHTLNALASERVKVGGANDHTKDTILRGQNPNLAMPRRAVYDTKYAMDKRFDAHIPGMRSEVNKQYRMFLDALEGNQRLDYHHLYHYRIVYKEVAWSYMKLRNLRDMYTVLIDVLKTLLIMHEAGWVHRDISVGNMYLYQDPETEELRGLLGDFEYAREVEHIEDDDKKIGTPEFMPTELLQGHFLFKPQRIPSMEEIRDMIEQRRVRHRKAEEAKEKGFLELLVDEEEEARKKEPKIDLSYNHLHDLESFWWVAVWTALIYMNTATPEEEVSREKLINQKTSYYELFPGDPSESKRYTVFTCEHPFEIVSYRIPSSFRALRRFVIVTRFYLIKAYEEAEKKITGPIRLSTTGTDEIIHDQILGLFDLEFEDIEVISIFRWEENSKKTTSKRQLEEEEEGEESSQEKKKARVE